MRLIIAFLLGSYVCLGAQTTSTFEEFSLPADSFLDGRNTAGGFLSGDVLMRNYFDATYSSWTGWAISSSTDTLTPGFMNQYSTIAGAGADSSNAFAVAYTGLGPSVIQLHNRSKRVEGLYVTNTTYAYRSMLEGDGFAKRFGGVTGNDPDFFLLTVKKYLDGQLGVDSVNFYLADYRSEEHANDYLIKDWTFLDLSTLGAADSLVFALSSSDNGQYGMNTPAYFCVDNIITSSVVTSVDPEPIFEVIRPRLYPNPVGAFLQIEWPGSMEVPAQILDSNGRLVQAFQLKPGLQVLPATGLPVGMYYLQYRYLEFQGTIKVVKN